MATILKGVALPTPQEAALSGPALSLQEFAELSRAPRRERTGAGAGQILGASQGAAGYVGENLLRADQVRRRYVAEVARLPKDAEASRAELKHRARLATPAPQRAWLQATRPDLGKRAGSTGGAARTNPAATAQVARLAKLGRMSAATSALLGGLEIATAKDKPRAATAVAGGVGGGLAGGIAGAEAGALIGSLFPGAGTVVGALVGGGLGSVGGGAIGHDAGGEAYDRVRGRR